MAKEDNEMGFDLNSAKALIESGMSEAQDMLRDPIRIDDLLISLEEALKLIPVAGETLADIPLTISLVKSYITKEYTEVSPKVVITLISAFIYIVKKKDLISDSIPFAGQVDDIAVLKLALTFVRPELDAYKEWRTAYRESKAVQNPNRAAEQADSAEKSAAAEETAAAEKTASTEPAAEPEKTAATEKPASTEK